MNINKDNLKFSKMARIFVYMNTVLFCIGSNSKDSNVQISNCRKLLQQHFRILRCSEAICSKPYGKLYTQNFTNQLIKVKTNLSQEDTINICKKLEQILGRKPDDKQQGIVVIDIDILIWNTDILKPNEMQRNYISLMLPQVE